MRKCGGKDLNSTKSTITWGSVICWSRIDASCNELVEPVLNNLTVSQYDNTGPIKYLYAPNHQILVKSASRKARNRIKADFATKVRNQVKNVLLWTVTNNKALKLVFHVWGGTFDSNSLFKGGTFESKTCDGYIGLIRVLPPVKCDPFASFSPNSNHPVCQLINILALLPDILQERQSLKLKLSNPESVTVKQW